jgi:ABC-type dipeptide/oligopeptide/nickel transport system permease subunit
MIRDRLKDSPAMRKLFGRKMTIFAMGIISLYLLLFCWIVLMEGVSWAGKKTGSFDLVHSDSVFGAMLPERTLDRIGASNEPGFGIRSEPTKRMEQVEFYIRNLNKMFEELDQSTSAGTEPRSIEEIRRSVSFAERHLVDLPVDELRGLYGKTQIILGRQAGLRSLRDTLPQMTIAIEKLEGFRASFDAATADTEEWEIAGEEVALTLDELLVLIENYREDAPEGDPLAELDLGPLSESMDAAFDYAPLDPIYDTALVEQMNQAVLGAGPGIDLAIEGTLGDLEPILDELYPLPGGVGGLVYRLRMMLGTDQQGRSIMLRAMYSAKVAIQVGVVVSVIAVFFGSLIGAAAGYFGGAMDHAVIWLYSTFSSIPYLVLLVVLAFMFTGSIFEGTLVPLYVAFSLTFWIGPCRVTRGEALKLRSLDYVQAAQALGASKWRILTRHIIPNTSHLIFINMSLLFIGAIKGEVVLTFLGLGLKDGASWGIMINQSKSEVVSGFFWQIGAATFFMFVLVLAFNVLTDALQDAFDPKHVG